MPRVQSEVERTVKSYLRRKFVPMAIDFCNLDLANCTPALMLDFYKKWSIGKDSQHDYIRGFSTWCKPRIESKLYSLSEPVGQLEYYMAARGELITPSNEKWIGLKTELSQLRAGVNEFIMSAAAGNLDIETLNVWAKRHKRITILFDEYGRKTLRPSFRFDYDNPPTDLESEIYLDILYHGYAFGEVQASIG